MAEKKITELEKRFIAACDWDEDFGYLDYENPFENKKTLSGVITSLLEKGIIEDTFDKNQAGEPMYAPCVGMEELFQ
jgi:hypothetical protein